MQQRTFLVTGAGRGAGLGISVVLSSEGGNVVVCDLDLDAVANSLRFAARAAPQHPYRSNATFRTKHRWRTCSPRSARCLAAWTC